MNPTSPEDKQYLLGLVGDARSLSSFWSMIEGELEGEVEVDSSVAASSLPGLQALGIVAAALPDAEMPPKKLDMGIGFPVYAGFREMLYMRPEINMVIETTGNPAIIKALRKHLPPSVTLVERAAASFFIKLMTSDSRCAPCKVDQLHTQTLYTTVMDQLKDDILFLDTEGIILSVNQALCNRLGMSKREFIGHDFRQHLASLGQESNACPFERARQTLQPAEGITTEVADDGHVRSYRIYMYPILYGGELQRMVAMRRDITKRTALEQRLAHSSKLASIGELSTYLAHEIRNPLFAISGCANSLRRNGHHTADELKKLEVITEESARLDDILKSILSLTRPASGHATPTDINHAVQRSIYALQLKDSAPFRITTKLARPLPFVAVDPAMLEQSLIHLLNNSLEAMPTGGTITVTTAMQKGTVQLSVADTGHGVSTSIRDQVFSPFFSTKDRNSGLGLSMTRKLMDDIGGDVELRSSKAKGTTVTLKMPPTLAVAQKDETA